MPDQPDRNAPVTPEEFRGLLRVAGLDVSDERAPAVLAELNAQLANGRAIDAALGETEAPAFAPFDPAFIAVSGEGDDA